MSQSNVKLYVQLPFVNFEKCVTDFKRINPNQVFGSGQLCAGGQLDKDSCTGDSGGPLMTHVSQPGLGFVYYQVGIVSYGPRFCGTGQLPAVYTDVREHHRWIEAHMYE